MDTKKLFLTVNRKAHEYSRKRIVEMITRRHYKRLENENIPLKKLSPEQKKQIDEVWGGFNFKDYCTHELIYSITGKFDPYYCSEKLFVIKLGFMLNKGEYVGPWTDKNYFDKFFGDIRFPNTLVRNIHGTFLDKDYNIISIDEAKSILKPYESVCIKPAIESGSGNGVAKVKIDENIEKVFKKYQKDFIVQELIEQYPEIKKLNESSVNVLRVNTLFTCGSPKVVSCSLRLGAPGAFNDNSISKEGKGMLVIGVDENGVLRDKAYESCGASYDKTHTGVEFKGLQIPDFDKIKETVIKIHSQMPFAKFIGFDVALDSDGEIIIMEYNLKAPGVFYYQLANGPLFGDYTKDIIKELTTK
ncbi:MAG: hypothetical protein J6A69_11980 [Clostridia bacterium]|nr:hypothetical protein [Clostridia bacterium]